MATEADISQSGGTLESSCSNERLLLVTTVDIGEGQSDRIEVREGDDTMEVARAFVVKHSLPQAIIPRLALHLEDNLAKVEAQKQATQQMRQMMAEGQDTSDAAVFHRLYEQAIALRHKLEDKRHYVEQKEIESIKQNKTQMSWISSEMMRDRGSGLFGNYGQMLYAESQEAQERKKEKIERRKAEKQKEEVAGVTFHPEISRLAQNLWTPQECAAVPAWQRLSKVKLTKAQERLEMLRREKEEAEMRECSFTPQVNIRSEKLMTERSETLRSLNVSAHQQLYQDAVRRQQKQQDYQHWYPEEVTFQPKLHESAKSLELLRRSLGPDAAAIMSGNAKERNDALVNRLYASYEKLQNKLQEARNTLQADIDPVTGKRLFHPETGRAPTGVRRAGDMPIGEHLYSLRQQQDERARAALNEKERKQREVAAQAKQSKGSRELVKTLQHKRFKQIFEFLDQEGLGRLNLAALMNSVPEWLDDLDDEVRADLEFAAKLLTKRSLKHFDSGKSEASSIFMPPPPSMDLAGAAAGNEGSTPSTPNGQPGVVDFQAFCKLMEEVLSTRRGLRTYLAPSPPRKYVPTETYRPQIDNKSKQLAARLRPKDKPLHDILYEERISKQNKLEEKKAEVELERTQACTFAPKLVSQQIVKEGRVMRGVREGTWYKHEPLQSELDIADNLQALAELVATGTAKPAAAAAGTSSLPAVEDSYSGNHEIEQDIWAAAARTATQQEQEELQRQVELEQQQRAEEAAAYEAYKQEYELQESEHKQQQESDVLEAAAEQSQQKAAAAVEEEGEAFEGSEVHQQYLELEREVQQMLEATTAVAAAAERLQSPSDQHYLSQILGLAQEQVDAMVPAISHLHSLEIHHSRHSSTTTAAVSANGEAAPAASTGTAAGGEDLTPRSSFRVAMPDLIDMNTPAAVSPAVTAAYKTPVTAQQQAAIMDGLASHSVRVTEDDLTTLGLLRSQFGGEAAAVISREPSSRASLLGKVTSKALLTAVKQGGSLNQQQYIASAMEGASLFELAAGVSAEAVESIRVGVAHMSVEELEAARQE